MYKKGREIYTALGLDSVKMVDLAVSMKGNFWYLIMYPFTFCFYYFLDLMKVVILQCIGKVATVLCYLGTCKPSCPGIVKPCCLWIYQYCCLGIYQLYCIGTFQPLCQYVDIQLGCPNEGLVLLHRMRTFKPAYPV